ncbi:AIR synthase family protein [Thermoanaerobacterium sp. DL9XJH110]|uniref:AIR synthase family protein n=1 Tax=Thermoanaerobacterium sp. DL9XJH110 TaxID=3386643 RepID=UPI003BB6B007
MKIGKIPPEILKKSVYPFLGKRRKEVLVHSGFGEDCSVIDFGRYVAVASSDPITGADKNGGYLSVFISCNDIAACGAEPVGILVTLLLPEGADEDMLKNLMEGIHRGAAKIGVEVLGGHSEITASVVKPVVSVTALGIAGKGEYVTSSGAKPGDDVIVTKALGLEGSAVLACDFEEFLKTKIPPEDVYRAQGFLEMIGVIEDGLTAARAGVSAMHDITEGGLLGAAYEVAEASGVGIEIYKEKLPILPETAAICRAFDIDPLGLISSGSMLICTPRGEKVMEALAQKDIPAFRVGKITAGGRYLISDGSRIPLKPPERDELYRAIEKAKR